MAKRLFGLQLAANSRNILLLALLIGGFATTSFGQIWAEDFNSYANGTTNGPPKWSSYATDCDDGGQLNQGAGQSQWGVWGGVFSINDAEGSPCCPLFGGGGNDNGWLSQVIDIEDFCNISISMQVSATGVFECSFPGNATFGCLDDITDNAHDQVLIEYSLNGGAWTQMAYICGDAGVGTITATGLNGSTLQIRFFASNKSNGEFYYIDNIVVSGSTAPTPTFPQVGPLCEDDSPVTLPTTSNQGINGTWTPPVFNPAGLGGTTTTVEFTAAANQCATDAEMDIVVNVAVTPTLPPLGPYCEDNLAVTLPTINAGIIGNWSGPGVSGNTFDPNLAMIGINTLVFTPVPSACATTNSIDVLVNAAAVPDLDSDVMCESDPPYDLNDLEDPAYPNGTWSGPGVSGNLFNPTGQSGSVILTFTSSAPCVAPATTNIIVNPLQNPNISGIPSSICELDDPISLPTNQSGINGSWSGPGVVGNMFNPTGQNGSVTLTFTPNTGLCAAPATTSINVQQAVTPSISGLPASICELDDPISLPTNQSGVNGNWSGPGVAGNMFDPSGQSGSVTLTFTPNAGLCANPATSSINVQQAITPVISGIPASICELAASINLPTNQNGINGVWSGPGVVGDMFDPSGQSGSVTLTFIPNAGQCANNASFNITVNPAANLVITGLPSTICETANSVNLPPAVGGFAGTWSGQGVSGNIFDPSGLSGIVTLTFTPNTGLCANPASTDIDVETPTTPNISGLPASVCELDAPIPLPTNQSGINGNWSGPGVSGNNFNPNGQNGSVTLTFTPNANQCATTATENILVTPATTPVITGIPNNICELEAPIILPTTQSGIDGTWSGPGVSNNTFDPTGFNGTISLTFTPNAGQCALNTNEPITVEGAIIPTITGVPASVCNNAPAFALPTNQGGIVGNWSGQGVIGNIFNPAGLNGTYTLTFTPDAGFCAVGATTDITVGNGGAPTLNGVPSSVCESAPPITLPSIQDGIMGDWSGQGVINNIFNPAGLNGIITLTFTPDASFCAEPATTTIEVGTGGAPTITGVPGNICQSANPISLPTTQDGIMGNWSGQGVTNNSFNPAGLNGNITLTFTPDATFCAINATTIINVGNGGTPTLSGVPNSICETGAAIALPTTQGGMTGTWSGQGVTNNNFNPMGLSGIITLTFTPAPSFCASSATTTISVGTGPAPNISGVPATICQSDQPIALPTTQGGMTGTWSGQGVTNNSFNPAALNGNITLTFTPAASFCANNATTSIAINQPATPALGTPSPLCQTGNVLILSTLNDPNYPAGTWSGAGVNGGNFDPSGQSGNVVLTFSPTVNCVNQATTSVTVNAPVSPILGTAAVCESDSPLNLAPLANPNYPNGNWSGPGVSGGSFDPNGQGGAVTLTFTPTANCTAPATTAVTVNQAPTFSALDEPCDATNTSYTVSFNINGGSAPYTVDGVTLTGNSFTSPPIASTGTYGFVIDDALGCGPVTVSGTENCNCTTDAGTMNIGTDPLVVCFNSANFSAPFNADQVLDGDDVLQFVLHDNPGGTLGTVIATSPTPVFPIPPGVVLGETYYVSSVAGNGGANGVNLNDDCLSVSQGFPVQFYLPTVALGPDATICASDCIEIPLNFTGNAPFIVDYQLTVNGFSQFGFLDNLPNSSSFEVCPSDFGLTNGTIIFSVGGFADNLNCLINFGSTPPSTTITVGNAVVNNINQTLCSDESLVVNGEVYDIGNPSGTQLFPGASFSGCDSVVNVNLAFYPPANGTYSQGICPGQIITINNTVYSQSNLTGTEVLSGASVNGCDSTVFVNLTLLQSTVNNLNQMLCPGESITVNGTVYDQTNLTGTEIIPFGSLFGCDSTINVNLSFYPPAVSNFTQTLCTGGGITINGTVYNEANPTGTEVIQDGSINGCDSTIIVILTFNTVVTNNLSQTLCPGESIVVNGTTYDASNPTGTETIPNGSFLGCDSTIVVNLSFYPVASSTLNDQLCIGGSMMVNGTVYDENNPTGIEILQNATINGCDSTVFVNLTFGTSVIVSYEETLCPGEVVFINGTMYSASNQTGSETFPQASYLGCDSTVNINLSFYPEAMGNITEILQVGGSIIVNGTVYDEQNPSGTEVFTGASYFGCDSTVIISLSFVGGNVISAITQVNSPLCQFGNDGSIVVSGISGGIPPYIVALNGSNSMPVVNFPVIFDNLTFGFHTLTVIDANGTVTNQEIFMPDALPFEVELGGTQTIPLGNSVTLDAASDTQITSWAWSPPDYLDCTDCPSPTSTPTNDITYTLAVTDINGCTSEGEVSIIVEKKQEVYVPNAFSPNNDGINDELTIFASPQVERVLGFQIYSRWGEQVFTQFDFPPNDLQFGWDGTFKGEIMDPAVFGWFAEIRFLDGQVRLFKGDVTLVR
jgi:gliding motility-associated-like protein